MSAVKLVHDRFLSVYIARSRCFRSVGTAILFRLYARVCPYDLRSARSLAVFLPSFFSSQLHPAQRSRVNNGSLLPRNPNDDTFYPSKVKLRQVYIIEISRLTSTHSLWSYPSRVTAAPNQWRRLLSSETIFGIRRIGSRRHGWCRLTFCLPVEQ